MTFASTRRFNHRAPAPQPVKRPVAPLRLASDRYRVDRPRCLKIASTPTGACMSGLIDHCSDDAQSSEPRGLEPAGRRVTDKDTTDISALLRFECEQLEREYADIERAGAALRLAEPALETWIKPPAPARPKPPPICLL